ncbi:MAG: GAF domain-containing protein, partial [Pseudomonadota bacterium]
MNEKAPPEKTGLPDRTIGRRESDFFFYNQVLRLNQVTRMGQIVTSILNMDELFEAIIEQTNQIMDTERSTVFLHDEKSGTLWSFVATAMEKNTIRIDSSYGVAGWVFQNREALILNDPYNDALFYGDIDSQSGFKTKNILCVPLISRRGNCIGVFQTLNKKTGVFNENDTELLVSLSHYVAIALENANLYEELKELDKVKERIINHLSHELKTPLAVLLAVLGQVSKKLTETGLDGLDKTIDRGRRNLNRLLDLQAKVDDIVSLKSAQEKQHLVKLLEDAASFVQKMSHETGATKEKSDFMNMGSSLLQDMLPGEEEGEGEVSLTHCLHDICDTAAAAMHGRSLTIRRSFEEDQLLSMNKNVLYKVCA